MMTIFQCKSNYLLFTHNNIIVETLSNESKYELVLAVTQSQFLTYNIIYDTNI